MRVKRLVRRTVLLLFRLLPSSRRVPAGAFGARLCFEVLRDSATGSEALVQALRLDRELYRLLSKLAKARDGGLHPKHRLMNYHDFFVQRIASHENVLDIGSGNGALTNDIACITDAKVVGVDLSAQNVEEARQTYHRSNLSFIQGDATEDLELGETRFDVLVLSNVLEHIEERVPFVCAWLAASGARKVLIRVPMFEREWLVPLKRELGTEWRLDLSHYTEFTESQLRREIADSGLVLEELVVRWGEFWCQCKVRDPLC